MIETCYSIIPTDAENSKKLRLHNFMAIHFVSSLFLRAKEFCGLFEVLKKQIYNYRMLYDIKKMKTEREFFSLYLLF